MNLSELIAHFADNAPGFARRLARAGLQVEDLRTSDELAALPVMRRDDLRALQIADPPFGGLLACDPGELAFVFQAPGPIYVPGSRRSDAWNWRPALRAAGFANGDLVLNGFGYHLAPAGVMFEQALVALGCTVIPGGPDSVESQVEILDALRVTGYVGLPSQLKALILRAEARNLRLCLQTAFVAGEPLSRPLRTFFEERDLSVREGYGAVECGALGYECERQDGWHVPEDVLVDVCDPATGDPLPPGALGEVVITLLTPEHALVRFGLGDLSRLVRTPCPCGRPTPRLMGWQGRVGTAVKVRGIDLHPQALRRLMTRFSEIVRFQAVIARAEDEDTLALRVVPVHRVTSVATLPERVARAIQSNLELLPEIEIVDASELSVDAPPVVDLRIWK
jgi:phenylacetate-CoA ligase